MRWFDDGLFSSGVQLIKPEPAILLEAARRFGAPAQELVFINDHAPNVDAARALGWQGPCFSSAAQCESDLAAMGLLPR